MRRLNVIAPLLKVAGSLPAVVGHVVTEVMSAFEDGDVTPDEAEAIARRAVAAKRDIIHVEVKGVDIVDAAAEADLAAFLGRVTANVVGALRG